MKAERPLAVLGEKAHASLGLLYTTPFFISAYTPEPCQYSQHAAGCSRGGGREGEVLSGHACSFLRLHPQGALRAILPCLSHFPRLLPLSFPPVSILSPMQAVHACGEHIKTICEAAWQLDKCKHGLEVFI